MMDEEQDTEGTTFHVDGVPVLVIGDAAHAVQRGYFPVSSTGFRSFTGRTVTQEMLEAQAREQAKERATALRRVQAALRERRPTEEDSRLGAMIEWGGAVTYAGGQAWHAKPTEAFALFSSAGRLAQRIGGLGPWTATSGYNGCWSPAKRQESCELYRTIGVALMALTDALALGHATKEHWRAVAAHRCLWPPRLYREWLEEPGDEPAALATAPAATPDAPVGTQLSLFAD